MGNIVPSSVDPSGAFRRFRERLGSVCRETAVGTQAFPGGSRFRGRPHGPPPPRPAMLKRGLRETDFPRGARPLASGSAEPIGPARRRSEHRTTG